MLGNEQRQQRSKPTYYNYFIYYLYIGYSCTNVIYSILNRTAKYGKIILTFMNQLITCQCKMQLESTDRNCRVSRVLLIDCNYIVRKQTTAPNKK